jgi:hypothetical protein
MNKFCIVAVAALGLVAGGASAQTSTTTSTQSTTSAPAPVVSPTVNTTTQRTVDSYGNVIDKTQTYTNGTAVTPAGDLATTRKTTETTTVR